jgi:hypothetical protein
MTETVLTIKPDELLPPPDSERAALKADPNRFIEGVAQASRLEAANKKIVEATKAQNHKRLETNIKRLIKRIQDTSPQKQAVKKLIHHLGH